MCRLAARSEDKTIVISRDLTQKEKDYLESQKKHPRSNMIAVDAIALIVNNDNPIEILSISEIRDILTGKITKWSDIEAYQARRHPGSV